MNMFDYNTHPSFIVSKYVSPQRIFFRENPYQWTTKNNELRINSANFSYDRMYRVLKVEKLSYYQYNVYLDKNDSMPLLIGNTYKNYYRAGNDLFQEKYLVDDLGIICLSDGVFVSQKIKYQDKAMKDTVFTYLDVNRCDMIPFGYTYCENTDSIRNIGSLYLPKNGCDYIEKRSKGWLEILRKRYYGSKWRRMKGAMVFGVEVHHCYFFNHCADLFRLAQKNNDRRENYGYFVCLLLGCYSDNPMKAKDRMIEFFGLDLGFLYSLL